MDMQPSRALGKTSSKTNRSLRGFSAGSADIELKVYAREFEEIFIKKNVLNIDWVRVVGGHGGKFQKGGCRWKRKKKNNKVARKEIGVWGKKVVIRGKPALRHPCHQFHPQNGIVGKIKICRKDRARARAGARERKTKAKKSRILNCEADVRRKDQKGMGGQDLRGFSLFRRF